MRRLKNRRTAENAKVGKRVSSNYVLLAIVFILMCLGLLFVFEASSIRALNETGDSFYYFKLQFRWVIIGLLVMFVFSKVSYKIYPVFAPVAMGFIILTLFLVLIPGVGKTAGGARSWIDLGFFNFQPAEFAKSIVVLYLSSWFFKKKKINFLSFAGFLTILIGLVLIQPDMGSAIMLFLLGLGIYYIAGQSIKPLIALLPVVVVAVVFLIISAPYRLKRLTAFLRPDEDPLGVGFHINQILISITEGGLFGRGFGASRQKFLYLPEAHTDSIFAIISEEMGFVGSLFVLFLFFGVLFKIYQIYNESSDVLGKYLTGGVFIYFCLQIIINLGGMVNIMPLTGVTLPFVSYGGSSMITSCMLIGIALNISRHNKNAQ